MTDITITQYKNQFINQFSLEVFHKSIVSIRAKAKTQGLTAYEHILYNILRGLPLDRGFSAAKNKNKLANGYRANYGFDINKVILTNYLSYTKNPSGNNMLSALQIPIESKEYFLKILKDFSIS